MSTKLEKGLDKQKIAKVRASQQQFSFPPHVPSHECRQIPHVRFQKSNPTVQLNDLYTNNSNIIISILYTPSSARSNQRRGPELERGVGLQKVAGEAP